MQDLIECNGDIEIIIQNLNDNSTEIIRKHNTVLMLGKSALASCLANNIGDIFNFYVTNLLLGTNGVDGGGNPKVVSTERTGLFGATLLSLPVFASLSGSSNQNVTFTSTVSSSQANGSQISELALQMANGNLYSMSTTGVISKDSSKQIVINWTVSFI